MQSPAPASISTTATTVQASTQPLACLDQRSGHLTGPLLCPQPLGSILHTAGSQRDPVKHPLNQGSPLLKILQELPISLKRRARVSLRPHQIQQTTAFSSHTRLPLTSSAVASCPGLLTHLGVTQAPPISASLHPFPLPLLLHLSVSSSSL